jgi:serine/threonine-protein kinase HipA
MTIVQSLDVWLDGFNAPAGRLDKHDDKSLAFSYGEAFLEKGSHPLSLSLPLSQEPVGDSLARAFFGNLLPENDQMRRVMERERLDRDDVVGILAFVGADCPGSISCLPQGSPPAKVPGVLAEDYRRLEEGELEQIVRSLAEHERLPEAFEDPSPVAGVQRKIALTLLLDGSYALPINDRHVPTTHILKVPRRGEGRDVALEAAAAQLAARAGLDVSIPEPLDIGGTPALLIRRFDRTIADGVVYRLHQEDFAQALGLPAELKYERRATGDRRFDVAAILQVLDASRNPALARRNFLLATLFNLAIGNTDNHAKNHALLYDGAPVPGLAPLYDLLPVRLSERYTHELAFNIGSAKTFDEMQAADLRQFLSDFGLDGTRLGRFLEVSVKPMLVALDAAAADLPRPQLKGFGDLIGRELSSLNELLGLEIALAERDTFQATAGGWTLS